MIAEATCSPQARVSDGTRLNHCGVQREVSWKLFCFITYNLKAWSYGKMF